MRLLHETVRYFKFQSADMHPTSPTRRRVLTTAAKATYGVALGLSLRSYGQGIGPVNPNSGFTSTQICGQAVCVNEGVEISRAYGCYYNGLSIEVVPAYGACINAVTDVEITFTQSGCTVSSQTVTIPGSVEVPPGADSFFLTITRYCAGYGRSSTEQTNLQFISDLP